MGAKNPAGRPPILPPPLLGPLTCTLSYVYVPAARSSVAPPATIRSAPSACEKSAQTANSTRRSRIPALGEGGSGCTRASLLRARAGALGAWKLRAGLGPPPPRRWPSRVPPARAPPACARQRTSRRAAERCPDRISFAREGAQSPRDPTQPAAGPRVSTAQIDTRCDSASGHPPRRAKSPWGAAVS